MFEVQKQDSRSHARSGRLLINRGEIHTPVFMPVGTRGTTRSVHHSTLKDLGTSIILSNTYHLCLRPGLSVIENSGGLKKFINWDRFILTDSGGYQVFSLANLRTISDTGAVFRSHIDGKEFIFTPENVIDAQRVFGSDIIMPLDECPPYTDDKAHVKRSSEMTLRWAYRAKERFLKTKSKYGNSQFLFGIVQGGIFEDLRAKNTSDLIDLDFDGYAMGGLAVGESKEELYRMIGYTAPLLPYNKPRYLMGIGTPADILTAVSAGVDMFDCVIPTREGRNGRVYTSQGVLNMKAAKFTEDFSLLDEHIPSESSLFSKAYVRYLLNVNEMLGLTICATQNIAFFLWLMKMARQKIVEGIFSSWKEEFLETYYKKGTV